MSDVSRYLARVLETARDTEPGDIQDLSRLSGAQDEHLAIAMASRDGIAGYAGAADHAFPLQSISKVFGYGAAIDRIGLDAVLARIDVEPSGETFTTVSLDPDGGRPLNPMINAGALMAHSLLGENRHEAFETVHDVMNRAAGRELPVHEETAAAEIERSDRNLSIAHLLRAVSHLERDAHEVVAGFVRQCAVLVTVRDLALMGATLAFGGVHPVTGERALSREATRQVLSVMMTCGMYDNAGNWVSIVGLPGKSGVSGGVLGVLPGFVGIAAYAPGLDPHGHSRRGIAAFDTMAGDLDLHAMERGSRDDRHPVRAAERLGARGGPRDRGGPQGRGEH